MQNPKHYARDLQRTLIGEPTGASKVVETEEQITTLISQLTEASKSFETEEKAFKTCKLLVAECKKEVQQCKKQNKRKQNLAAEKLANAKKQQTEKFEHMQRAASKLADVVNDAAAMLKEAAQALVLLQLSTDDVAYKKYHIQMVEFFNFAETNIDFARRILQKALDSNYIGLDEVLRTGYALESLFMPEGFSKSNTIETLRNNAKNAQRHYSLHDVVPLCMMIEQAGMDKNDVINVVSDLSTKSMMGKILSFDSGNPTGQTHPDTGIASSDSEKKNSLIESSNASGQSRCRFANENYRDRSTLYDTSTGCVGHLSCSARIRRTALANRFCNQITPHCRSTRQARTAQACDGI